MITINQLEKILSKKKQAIIGLEKELINIFSGDSDLDKNIIMKMLVNTKDDVEKIKKQLGDHNKKLNEVNLKIGVNKDLIDKYKKFNNTYQIADCNQKKLLLQAIVEKITFYGEEVKITLFLE